jgi:hypothetical protein
LSANAGINKCSVGESQRFGLLKSRKDAVK